MKCLYVQLQPALYSGDVARQVDALCEIASKHSPDTAVEVEHGDDDGPYINVNIYDVDIPALWSAIGDAIQADPALASATIVCCEGDNGWDDYLLLHHFDKTESLDALPATGQS